jgi:uncharacterized protein YkwD
VLPALTALLAGALVAGAATVLANPGASTAADEPGLHVGLTDSQFPNAHGDLNRPTRGSADDSPSSADDPTPDPTTTTSSTTTPPAPPPETTTPAPPPADLPPATPGPSQQDQVVTLVNTFRGQAGCGPLTVDVQLTAAAQGHSSDMANRDYFSHDTPEGVTFDKRIRNAGYESPGAENIAMGARTAEEVMRMWMESAGHRANILNCDLDTIGVGLDRNGFYWTQDFGY